MIDGSKLRMTLQRKGISVAQLGRMLGWDGFPAYLYRLMQGKHEAKQEFLERVSAALDVPPVEIMPDSLIAMVSARARVPVLASVGGVGSASPPFPDPGLPPSAEVEILDLDAVAAGSICALRVEGDSFEPFLKEGDLVAIAAPATFREGQLCLVRAGDGRTWIRPVYRDGELLLLPGDGTRQPPVVMRPIDLPEVFPVRFVVHRT